MRIKKSIRNKTITISDKEKPTLLRQLCFNGDIKRNGVILDTVISAHADEVLNGIDDDSISLVFIDPPYLSKSNHSAPEYRRWLEELLFMTYDKMKNNASIYICQDWYGSSIVEEAILNADFTIQNRITWVRNKGRGALRNWKSTHEDIWFATKTDDYKFNLSSVLVKKDVKAPYRDRGVPKDWGIIDGKPLRLTMPSNMWTDMCVPFWSMPENTEHPHQKPEKLLERIIKASSDKGDTVLDFFAGSGTTGVVAKRLGRHFILIEKDTSWCCIAQKRINEENSVESKPID